MEERLRTGNGMCNRAPVTPFKTINIMVYVVVVSLLSSTERFKLNINDIQSYIRQG